MILSTSHGDFPIPAEVAGRLPAVPVQTRIDATGRETLGPDFVAWLEASPENLIAYERLKRWHLVQDELAGSAARAGELFRVTDDGLD